MSRDKNEREHDKAFEDAEKKHEKAEAKDLAEEAKHGKAEEELVVPPKAVLPAKEATPTASDEPGPTIAEQVAALTPGVG